jgi:hypothetical protein
LAKGEHAFEQFVPGNRKKILLKRSEQFLISALDSVETVARHLMEAGFIQNGDAASADLN